MWETAVHLAVACGVFYGVFCAVLFSRWMSWMGSGISAIQVFSVVAQIEHVIGQLSDKADNSYTLKCLTDFKKFAKTRV